MLQSLFEEAIRQHASEIIADLVASKLEAKGVALGERDRAKLLRALLEGEEDELRFRSWRFWDRRNISVELSEEDLKFVDAEFEAIYEELPAIVASFVARLSPEAGGHIRRQYRKEIRKDRKALRRFRTRLHRTWKDGFDLLHWTVELATRIGQEAGTQALESYESADVLASVLIRLHGRGIRICRETLVLLESGYPEAAMTRWRALHELVVVALFIKEHGEQCAADYVLHEAVQEFRVARRYQEAAPHLGFAPLNSDEFESLKESAESAVESRGPQFRREYGWAFKFLDGHPCHFAGLEEAVAMSHLRPFYSRASTDVHAGAAALSPWLSRASQDTVLVGPSNAGIADPGQNMALSIGLLTTTLATLAPTLDSLVGSQVLVDLTNEVGEVLVGIREEVDRRWKPDD